MSKANHKVRERCLICDGSGRDGSGACRHCGGSGFVFAVTGSPQAVLLATGDCKLPLRKAYPAGIQISRNFA